VTAYFIPVVAIVLGVVLRDESVADIAIGGTLHPAAIARKRIPERGPSGS